MQKFSFPGLNIRCVLAPPFLPLLRRGEKRRKEGRAKEKEKEGRKREGGRDRRQKSEGGRERRQKKKKNHLSVSLFSHGRGKQITKKQKKGK